MNNVQNKLQIYILIFNIYQRVISNKLFPIYRFLLSYGRSGLCGIAIKNTVQKNRNFNLVTKTDVNMHLFYEQRDCIYMYITSLKISALHYTEEINILRECNLKEKNHSRKIIIYVV